MGKRRDDSDEPTLELPSFFRRRSRRAGTPVDESSEPPGDESAERPSSDPSRATWSERAAVPAAAHSGEPTEHLQVDDETAVLATDTAHTQPAESPTPPSEPEPQPAAAGGRRAARAARTGPLMSAGAASLVAGLVVGAVGTALTWAALQGCEVLRGTDSCGGPGLLVLVAILALMVVAGALLLKALRITEPNATSFLGVGLMVVIVLVTLMESLFSAWMFLAVPLLSALSFLAAQWVSTRFVDTDDTSPGVDIR